MNRFVLSFLAIAALGLGACRGQISAEPPVHPQLNMDQQKRIDAQEPSDLLPAGLFADGRGMRERVAGTVPALGPDGTGFPCIVAEDNSHLCQGKLDGEWADVAPMEIDLAFLNRGKERYEIYCAPCHDVAGVGKGPVIEHGMLPPPSFHDNRLRKMPLGQVYDLIANGVRNMPAYGTQILPEDRWAVAAYVRTLQLSQNVGLDDVPRNVAKSKGWK